MAKMLPVLMPQPSEKAQRPGHENMKLWFHIFTKVAQTNLHSYNFVFYKACVIQNE
jgi:hypothetical protein